MNRLEKIFNFRTLLIFNALVIVAAEFAGGGQWFYQTGAIHVVAVFFILLASSRIFSHRYVYDAFLETFIHASIAAYALFALSHLAEFLSYAVLKLPADISFANVANFYIIGLLVISLGAEHFLRIHDHREQWQTRLLWITILPFVLLAVLMFTPYSKFFSLELDSPLPYVYLAATVLAWAVAFRKTRRIGRLVTLSLSFSVFQRAAIVLVALSVLPNIFYDFLEDVSIPKYQIIYLAHFLFYLSMTLMFLSFSRVRLTGIYAGAEEDKTGEKKGQQLV